jgi:hypothetical protein
MALRVIASVAAPIIVLFERFKHSRAPQVAGAELPAVPVGIDLSKRCDIAYGGVNGYSTGVGYDKLTAVRILAYLTGQRDATTGEYMDSRWLVAELRDGRRAYLRPRSVYWLLESAEADAAGTRRDKNECAV